MSVISPGSPGVDPAGPPRRPRIAVTLGDPAGIGPELAAKLLARPETSAAADVVLLADLSELRAAEAAAGLQVPLADRPDAEHVAILDDGSAPRVGAPLREVSAEAGARAIHQLERALALAASGEVDAIVFTPLNKASLKLGGMDFEDELRWFASVLGHQGATSELNVLESITTARVTSHIPHAEVADRITAPAVRTIIELLDDALRGFGISAPRIGVAALNPHAGENGSFGRHEIDVIAPAVEEARAAGFDVSGPYPADTIFVSRRQDLDGIVTMYHDQGQIAMKLLGFESGVTMQGGLPVTITTPAHGTAFDIVGKGIASTGPTFHAFDLAVSASKRRIAAR